MTIIDTPAASVDGSAINIAEANWQLLRELTPATSQRVFRAIMDAFARPGTVHRIPTDELPVGLPAAVLPLLALADLMTPMGALRSIEAGSDAASATGLDAATDAVAAIARVVGARVVPTSAARYALALAESAQLSELSPGTHWSPETAATLVQRVGAIRTDVTSGWRLTGPGIPPYAPVVLAVDGLSEQFIAARTELVSDYPSGIDSILVCDDGTLVALSRTTRIELI